MANSINVVPLKLITSLFLCGVLFLSTGVMCQSVPAIYIFGDSLVDVGNNNHLPLSLLKANFPHNCVDFPTREATGRFSNGKNAADFLAEKVGLPTAPQYLSLKSEVPITGVSFASGGAGLLNRTDDLFRQAISMTQQVEYFALVHDHLVQQLGSDGARAHLVKSLLVVPGVGVIGCCPARRKETTTSECKVEANDWSTKYNNGLKLLLQDLKLDLSEINYSYFDTYGVMNNIIQNPQTYGIIETKEACCGLGNMKADVPCIPIATYCSNRKDHLFWDRVHPTEIVSSLFANLLYNGTQEVTFPRNVEQLAKL